MAMERGRSHATFHRDAIVLNIAIGIVGITFGVLADSAGLSVAKAVVMSAFVLTGASQFAAVSVVKDGGSAVTAVGGALVLAARNMLYGPVLAPWLRGSTARRAVAAQMVIDETTGMAAAESSPADAERAFWFTGVTLTIAWVGGTAIGAVVGGRIGDPDRWGLDAAFPAAFLALLAPQVRARPGQVAAVIAGVITVAVTPFTPKGVPILLAAFAVVPAMVLAQKRKEGA
jgi:4-azaleucine resistance transporter AzlC